MLNRNNKSKPINKCLLIGGKNSLNSKNRYIRWDFGLVVFLATCTFYFVRNLLAYGSLHIFMHLLATAPPRVPRFLHTLVVCSVYMLQFEI